MNNPLIEALKKQSGIRVSTGSRWLVFDDFTHLWVVYERVPYARKTTMVCDTSNLELAVSHLIDPS